MKKWKVYIIGAGPGECDLITVRGAEILKEADVIIHDYLVDKRIFEYVREGAEFISCGGLGASRQAKINALLVEKARAGKKVIRLKGGDPFIFGREAEELEALVGGKIEFEVVSGVTAATAAASFSGIPLTYGKKASTCVFVTGQEDLSKKESLIDWTGLSKAGTVVFYMGVGNLGTIAVRLIKAGKDPLTPAAIIEKATLPSQKVVSGALRDISKRAKKKNIRPPAILIIGETARFSKRFDWLGKTKRVLFTGLAEERYFQRERYEHIPLIKIVPAEDYRGFDAHLKKISGFDWVVFTSRYGVEHFFNRLKATGLDARTAAGVKIAVIGESTRRKLLEYALKADLVPENESSKGLIKAFKNIDLKGKKIFLPRSDISDKGIEAALEKMGADITSAVAYRNVMPGGLPDIEFDNFDEIIFTSPSTVRNFIKRYSKAPAHIKVSCIGDVTRKEAKRWHLI